MSLADLELVSLLGEGGMGRVWLARHPEYSAPLAVKVLAPEIGVDSKRSAALQREVRTLASMSHPGVVTLVDWGFVTAEDAEAHPGLSLESPWLMTEGVIGRPFLEVAKTFEWRRLKGAFKSILSTLAHLHGRGWLHRDISPNNVLWSERERSPVLIDFGLSSSSLTSAYYTGGTRGFVAPEQLNGGTMGPWTDLYGFGRLASMACFSRSTPLKTPPGLLEWLNNLLQEDPALRFRRAADAIHALESLSDELLDQPSSGDMASGTATPLEATVTHATSELQPEDSTTETPVPFQSAPPLPENLPRRPLSRPRIRWNKPALSLLPFRDIPVVGRLEERKRLWQLYRETVNGESSTIVRLDGPVGVGVSRMLTWLWREVHESGGGTPISALDELHTVDPGRLPVLLLDEPEPATVEEAISLASARKVLLVLGRPPSDVATAQQHRLELDLLPEISQGELVRSQHPCSPEICGWVVTQAGGHPGKTRELIHELLDSPATHHVDGDLCWVEGGRPVPDLVPKESLGELIERSNRAERLQLIDLNIELCHQLERSLDHWNYPPLSDERFHLWRNRFDLMTRLQDAEAESRLMTEGYRFVEGRSGETQGFGAMRRLLLAHWRHGERDQAIAMQERFREESRGTDYEPIAECILGQASALYMSDPAATIEIFRRAIRLAEESGPDRIIPHALEGVALCANVLRDFDLAIESAERARSIWQSKGQEQRCAVLDDRKSIIMLSLEDYEGARDASLKCIARMENMGRMSPLIPLLNLIAAEHHLGNRHEVEVLLDEVSRRDDGYVGKVRGCMLIYFILHAAEDRDWQRWDEIWDELTPSFRKAPEMSPSFAVLFSDLWRLTLDGGSPERAQMVAEYHDWFCELIGWELAELWGQRRLATA